jgi:hypothetical protein
MNSVRLRSSCSASGCWNRSSTLEVRDATDEASMGVMGLMVEEDELRRLLLLLLVEGLGFMVSRVD